MNKLVKVTYALSTAGQRAALIAGRNAAQTVTEEMELTDMALVDKLGVTSNGTLFFEANKAYPNSWSSSSSRYEFDAPPAGLAELVGTISAFRADVDAKLAAEKAEADAKIEAERIAAEELAAHDAPIIDEVLSELEEIPLLDPLPAACISGPYSDRLWRGGVLLAPLSAERKARLQALNTRRREAYDAAEAAKAQAIIDAREKIVAEHGGYWWKAQGGLTGFKGYELWSNGQTKRWVGVFTKSKGIDTFLSGPRGEFMFEVSDLRAGDCIQGAGYDIKYNGKRRDESEWFGVVVRNDNDGLVVKILNSRTACLQYRAPAEEQ